jgi:predicted RNA-binding Zn-ribbon protein involved in translation (DUF1610 family)
MAVCPSCGKRITHLYIVRRSKQERLLLWFDCDYYVSPGDAEVEDSFICPRCGSVVATNVDEARRILGATNKSAIATK